MTTVKRALVRKRLFAVVAAALLGASTTRRRWEVVPSRAAAEDMAAVTRAVTVSVGEAMRWATAAWEGTASQ
jgi:uncharacterized lipoprotein YajG